VAQGPEFVVIDNQNYAYSDTRECDACSSSGDVQLHGIRVQWFVPDALP
jgi:hypothetical protein